MPIADNGKPSLESKLLLGWMEEAEAMQYLLQECRSATPFTETSARGLWNRYKDAVAALPPRPCLPPNRIPDLSQKEEYAVRHLMQKHKKHPQILGVLKLDDPARLVAHQLFITVPQ